MDENSGQLVTIDRFFHPTNAHIAAGRLESEGIPVHLLGINHASANWLISNALGGIQLQVPRKFAEEARAVLSTGESLEETETDSERCPKCGSSSSTACSTAWKASFLAVHLLSIPLPWDKNKRQCEECGHKWVPGVT